MHVEIFEKAHSSCITHFIALDPYLQMLYHTRALLLSICVQKYSDYLVQYVAKAGGNFVKAYSVYYSNTQTWTYSGYLSHAP